MWETHINPWSGRSHMPWNNQAKDHKDSAGALEPQSHNYCVHVLQLLRPTWSTAGALEQEKPLQWEACAPHLKKGPCSDEHPEQPKVN